MNSEETVKAIKRVEEEIERRKSLPIYNYNTGAKIHEKQVAFHKCKKRNRWVFGGNRSGKTECGAVETVYMARGIHPYRENRKEYRYLITIYSNTCINFRPPIYYSCSKQDVFTYR